MEERESFRTGKEERLPERRPCRVKRCILAKMYPLDGRGYVWRPIVANKCPPLMSSVTLTEVTAKEFHADQGEVDATADVLPRPGSAVRRCNKSAGNQRHRWGMVGEEISDDGLMRIHKIDNSSLVVQFAFDDAEKLFGDRSVDETDDQPFVAPRAVAVERRNLARRLVDRCADLWHQRITTANPFARVSVNWITKRIFGSSTDPTGSVMWRHIWRSTSPEAVRLEEVDDTGADEWSDDVAAALNRTASSSPAENVSSFIHLATKWNNPDRFQVLNESETIRKMESQLKHIQNVIQNASALSFSVNEIGISLGLSLKYPTLEEMSLNPLSEDIKDRRKKRWLSFNQFIQYEHNYMKSLKKVDYDIYGILLLDESILPRETSITIFKAFNAVCKLNLFTCGILAACARHVFVDGSIGFLIWAMLEQPTLFQVYSTFVLTYERAKATFHDEMARNRPFELFIKGKLEKFGEKLSFEAYFMKPLQRMPHFILQLQDLIKYTPADHADMAILEKCLTRARKLSSDLNTLQGQSQTRGKLVKSIEGFRSPKGQSYVHSYHNSRLLYDEALQEMTKEKGRVAVYKDRHLFLMDDRIICGKFSDAKQFGSSEKLLLKWMIPLQDVEVDEAAQNNGSSFSSMMQQIKDYEVFSKIKEMLGTLQYNYESMPIESIEHCMSEIRFAVLAGMEDNNETRMELSWARDTRTKLCTFGIDSRSKRQWQNMIRMAKLALSPENTPAWLKPTDNVLDTNEPLLVRKYASGENQAWLVCCGCSYESNLSSSTYETDLFRTWCSNKSILWVCSIDGNGNSSIFLYNHDRTANDIKERTCLVLENFSVTSIVHVPDGLVHSKEDTVWLGSADQLLIYSATYPMIDEHLYCRSLDGESPTKMLYYMGQVFVGMKSGMVLVYRLQEDGVWDLDTPLVINLMNGAIAAMTVVRANVFIAAGSAIFVFPPNSTGRMVKAIEVSASAVESEESNISLLHVSVNGIWIVRERSKIISLYHTECYKHLLDINLSEQILRFLPESQHGKASGSFLTNEIYVTALTVADSTLWVGTNVGLILTMELPRFVDVPILAEHMRIAYHGHIGDVNFLLPLLPQRTVCSQDEAIKGLSDPKIIMQMYLSGRNSAKDMKEHYYFYFDPIKCHLNSNKTREYSEWEHEPHEDNARKQEIKGSWGPHSTLLLTGGRGYVNWRETNSDETSSKKNLNIILWEKPAEY